MNKIYSQIDWEGAQDAAETAFIVLRKEVSGGDIAFVQHAAVSCKSAIETCVTVAAVLGIPYGAANDFEALRTLAWQGVCKAA